MRLRLALGMGAEDHAVSRQHQTTADPGDARRDPLSESRIVVHSLWEGIDQGGGALESSAAYRSAREASAAADITSRGAGWPVHNSKDRAACSSRWPRPPNAVAPASRARR